MTNKAGRKDQILDSTPKFGGEDDNFLGSAKQK